MQEEEEEEEEVGNGEMLLLLLLGGRRRTGSGESGRRRGRGGSCRIGFVSMITQQLDCTELTTRIQHWVIMHDYDTCTQ